MQLHRQFIKTAKERSNKIAIIDRYSNREMTFEKTLIASIILTGKFNRYEEGFLGIMIPTSLGSILSVLATIMAGKVPVMINYSTGAAQNAEYAQKKCGFKTIITSRALVEKIGCRIIEGMIFIEDILSQVSWVDKLTAAAKAKLPTELLLRFIHQGSMDDNAVILFTSGSEKSPKAVQLTHRNILCNIKDAIKTFTITQNDSMLSALPLFHVFGYTVNCWLPLLTGMMMATYPNPLDYRTVCSIIRDYRLSLVVGTPIFFQGYLKVSQPGDFDSIRIAVAGADKLPDALRQEYLSSHNLELLEGYGATETSPVISTNYPGQNKHGSVGKPLPSVQVRITVPETDKIALPGQTGKILVKGDLVMKGYFDDLEETSYRIHNGWYDTGDMGMIDEDGFLWHKGRLRRFVKIGGEMISLVQVENCLEKQLPEHVFCCVVEVPDSLKGARIVAAVTEPVNTKEILKKMARELPNIALPKEFFVIDELPKMGSGKIDFRTITELVKNKLKRE